MMFEILDLLRLGEFMLYDFFKDGEYKDLWPTIEEYYKVDTVNELGKRDVLHLNPKIVPDSYEFCEKSDVLMRALVRLL